MRYITVPEPFSVVDPIEGTPLPGAEAFPFAKFVKVLTSNAASEQTADTLTLVDIRREAEKQSAGVIWAVSDEWFEILKKQAVRVKGAQPAFVFSAESHVRAIVNAPDKPSPAVAALPPANA